MKSIKHFFSAFIYVETNLGRGQAIWLCLDSMNLHLNKIYTHVEHIWFSDKLLVGHYVWRFKKK